MDVYDCYLKNVLTDQEGGGDPLVSVFTPTCRTGGRICRPFLSLMEQTYANWEWIAVDDSDDGGEAFRRVLCGCQDDPDLGPGCGDPLWS